MELQKIDNKNRIKLLPLFIFLFIAIIGYFVGPRSVKYFAEKFYAQSPTSSSNVNQVENGYETLKLEPEDNTEDFHIKNQSDNDYQEEVESIDIIDIEQIYESIDAYRRFLFNVNQLTTRFSTNKSFTSYLNEIDIIEMPKNIYKIISNMQRFDQLKQQISSQDPEPFIKISKLLSRFIKIKKIPKESAEIENLRQKISQNLPFLLEFFYSQEVQNSFIGN